MAKAGIMLTTITDINFEAATKDGSKIGDIPIVEGVYEVLPESVKKFVVEKLLLLTPNKISIIDGNEQQIEGLKKELVDAKMMVPLKAYDNNWLVRTDPKDVAEMQEASWIVTDDRYEAQCHTANNVKPLFGNWMSPKQCSDELDERFPKCMTGRTAYVLPFSLGPNDEVLCMRGVMLTDSPYIALLMCIMARVSPDVWLDIGEEGSFVSCIHSVGVPLPTQKQLHNNWPCNLEKAVILHLMKERQVWIFGTTFGTNALASKNCFGLRIASSLACQKGWLVGHMVILGVTPPGGEEIFIAVALPSGSGKTALSMMEPTVRGWTVRCVGCDVAWFKFGLDDRLYGFNPENGIYATAPGTNSKTAPKAIACVNQNTIFTNVAETANGEYFWEGLEHELQKPDVEITNWESQKWKIGQPGRAAHPNARYCAPFQQISHRHPEWETTNGVPISAIVFGARRASGMPLVMESFSWQHGIFWAASLRSEMTCASSGHTENKILHDPMAMGSFVGCNMGKYLQHWLSVDELGHKLPKIFYVNFFRKDANGKYMWPGFGDNIRILDWIIKKIGGAKATISCPTAIGNMPLINSINCAGMRKIDMSGLFEIRKEFWLEEAKETRKFFEEQFGSDLPEALKKEMEENEQRINGM